jgi:Flp pilus assembly protein TadG
MNARSFRMSKTLRSFGRDRRGASAIEFAIVAPLMLALYVGVVEISEGVAADRKVTLTSGTLANITAQSQALTHASMDNILNASIAIMTPYTGTISAKVSCLKIDASKVARVAWGAANTGTAPHSVGDVITIPDDLAVANSSVIFSEVSYLYIPVTGYVPGWSHISANGITLSDRMFMSPRLTPPSYDDGGGGPVKTCS